MAVLLVASAAARAQSVGEAPGVDRRTPVVRAVERAAPAVVNISTERLVRNPYYGRSSLFERFFGMRAGPREQLVQNSLGSGVIVDPSGYVVTNEHVVAAASRATVTFLDGTQVAAEFVGTAPEYDLAVLKLVEDGPYPYLPVDFTDDLLLGETVIAIGNPYGLASSVTTGVLSGEHRRVESGGREYADFLQTDAAINPGNSGGALLTVNGDLIGINTQVHAQGQNLGFAIPVARVRKVVDELVQHGEVLDVWMGMVAEELEALHPVVRKRLRVPDDGGLLVRRVHDRGPADRAGLRPGDVIVGVGERSVHDTSELRTALAAVRVGDRLALEVLRDGVPLRLSTTARAFPDERAAELGWRHFGLEVVRVATGPRAGYVAIGRVREGSEADQLGLRPGLALLGVDGQRIESVGDFHRAIGLGLSRSSILLAVSDGRAVYRVPLPQE